MESASCQAKTNTCKEASTKIRRRKNQYFAIGTLSTLLLGGTFGAGVAAERFRSPSIEVSWEEYRYRAPPLSPEETSTCRSAYHAPAPWTLLYGLVFGAGAGIGYGNMLRHQRREDALTNTGGHRSGSPGTHPRA